MPGGTAAEEQSSPRWPSPAPPSTTGLAGAGDARAGTLSGTLYRDPTTQAARWVQAHPDDARTPVIRDKIASQPQAHWLAAFNPTTVTSEVSGVVDAANAADQIPVFSVYEIPNRDCGGASAGGAPDYGQYQQWITDFTQGWAAGPSSSSWRPTRSPCRAA